MCGYNQDSTVTEIVVAVVKNEKFFENMTTEEKIKSVAELYRALNHEIVEHGEHEHHEHEHHHR
jgi:ABC-type Na+ transport system ATPase subunit NatA